MEECGWNKKQAARRLGISRSTLYEKLKKHRVSRPSNTEAAQRSGKLSSGAAAF